jgi:F0F1-type ATP synthase membrane subunit b/b'
MSEALLYFRIAVWSQIASSVLFIGVLVFIWFRWLLPVFLAAQERSNRQISEAERHRDEVKGALEALREEIESARRDAQLIEQRARQHAERERELSRKEATEAGNRALADANRELERARAAERHRLRDEMVDAALRLARETAIQRVGPDLDARFVDRITDSLEPATHG